MRLALRRDGVEIREGARVVQVEPLDPTQPAPHAGVMAVLEDGTRLSGTHLLLAVGRLPRLAGLDLPAAGVQAGPRGVVVSRRRSRRPPRTTTVRSCRSAWRSWPAALP
ncbi:MAG: hypothetical protein QJR07_21750 [Acetobacteraceae bacterium]|nr:hypothetical protein [Acetobacteraceae bacterium]